MADVRITEFTDPGCPWAFSAELFRLRLEWLYGDQIEWLPRMVVLAESPEEYEDKGFDVKRQSSAYRSIARDHGMPIDTSERPRMAATAPACRAFVAARMHAPERSRSLLRCLRVHSFAGGLLDAPVTLEAAAVDAGLDPAQVDRWAGEDEVEAGLRDEMLASAEVASVCELSHDEAREQLGRVAIERHVGADGFWTPAA